MNELTGNLTTIKLNRRVIQLEDTIKQLALDIKKIQADDSSETDIFTRLESAIGTINFERTWNLKTRSIGNSFVLGHSVNGILGSPHLGINGNQITLGSASVGAYSIIKSGGTY